jgi:hypothetical protein
VLVPIDDTSHTGFAAWSPDNRRLLVTSNRGNGYDNVAVLDAETGALDWITDGCWEAAAHDWSRDGRHLVYTRNVEGDYEAVIRAVDGGQERRLPLPPGVFGKLRFSPDGGRVAALYSSADRPADVFVTEVAAGTVTQSPTSFVGGITSAQMTRPARVRYPSFDGTPISSFLYVPPGLAKNGSHPAIVYVHGGPTAQHTNGFRRDIQYLVDRGYLVLAPNYRGSTGFGRAFEEANRMDLGGGDFRDCCEAARFLATTGYAGPHQDRADGRLLRRLHDPDGPDQGARAVGGRRGHRALRQLVHGVRERGRGAAGVRPRVHGRPGRARRPVARPLAVLLRRQHPRAAAAAGRRQRHPLPGRGNAADDRRDHRQRRRGRGEDLRGRGPRVREARELDRRLPPHRGLPRQTRR